MGPIRCYSPCGRKPQNDCFGREILHLHCSINLSSFTTDVRGLREFYRDNEIVPVAQIIALSRFDCSSDNINTHCDALRPSFAEITKISSLSHSLWSGYLKEVEANAQLSFKCVQLDRLLGAVPYYLGRESSERASIQRICSIEKGGDVFVTGTSEWFTGTCGMEPKVIEHDLILGVQKPTICTFIEDGRLSVWPGVQGKDEPESGGNKIAILFFAWAYIISARWLELQASVAEPGKSNTDSLCYCGIQSNEPGLERSALDPIVVDVGDADEDASFWWASILSQGEGWRATCSRGGYSYRSPWSMFLSSKPVFEVWTDRKTMHSKPLLPPASHTALEYLTGFCVLHNLTSECSVALSAVIFLPFARNSRIALPVLK